MVTRAVPTIVVDQERCIAAGECIYNHPDYFDWGDGQETAAVIKAEIVTSADRLHAEQAVSMCPGAAISIVDD